MKYLRLPDNICNSPEYGIWQQARARCHDPSHKQYDSYGGRGIIMWWIWRNDFEAYYMYTGKRPLDHPIYGKYTLDRKDNDEGYVPGNVHWATYAQQTINRRPHSVSLTNYRCWPRINAVINGITMSLSMNDAAKYAAYKNISSFYQRLNNIPDEQLDATYAQSLIKRARIIEDAT